VPWPAQSETRRICAREDGQGVGVGGYWTAIADSAAIRQEHEAAGRTAALADAHRDRHRQERGRALDLDADRSGDQRTARHGRNDGGGQGFALRSVRKSGQKRRFGGGFLAGGGMSVKTRYQLAVL
jgi:hypothetical protein